MNKLQTNILKIVALLSVILAIIFLILFLYYIINYNKEIAIKKEANSNLYVTVEIVDEVNGYEQEYLYKANSKNLGDCIAQHPDTYQTSMDGDFISSVKEDENIVEQDGNNFWQIAYLSENDYIVSPVGMHELNYSLFSNVFKIYFDSYDTYVK